MVSGSSPHVSTVFHAHSKNDGGRGVAEFVRDHVQRVTELARHFAVSFQMEQQAEVAALLHDLGKYSEQFQRRLKSRREPSRDHWSIGALLALKCYKSVGLYPALAIRGHHVGLDELSLTKGLLEVLEKELVNDTDGSRFTTRDIQQVWRQFQSDHFTLPRISRFFKSNEDDPRTAAEMLDVRMLFSALVDADYLATEGHFAGDASDPYRRRAPGDNLHVESAIAAFEKFVRSIREMADVSPMRSVRDQVGHACLSGASRPTGTYTLSAPTGSGKTLAMLAFALLHAKLHGLRRIVIVLPFLNIIEQTAKIYRDIFDSTKFGSHFILEDHCLADNVPADASAMTDGQLPIDQRRRMLTENWDAPIIITTNVKLLESLHARKPGRCRKLHRLAKSVILFDEVQTLPPQLAKITLGTLSRLSDPGGPYGSTVVFATATQPAFTEFHCSVAKLSPAGWQPAELITSAEQLFSLAGKRIKVNWRHQDHHSFSELVDDIERRERVLTIVNLKRHAIKLIEALNNRCVKNVIHLSTNLCAVHRVDVLRSVRKLLATENAPIRLIATQCIEAGVDVSFPSVLRAIGPLEAIAQAAGRCNRSGEGPTGEVIVFRWPSGTDEEDSKQYPPGYKNAVDVTESFLKTQNLEGDILHSPEKIRAYYQMLYAIDGRSTETASDEKGIVEALKEQSFTKVDEAYRLINSDTISVIVPYSRIEFDQLHAAAERPLKGDELREWYRKARPLTVNVYRLAGKSSQLQNFLSPVRFGPLEEDYGEEPETKWYWLLDSANYDSTLGLTFPVDMTEMMIV